VKFVFKKTASLILSTFFLGFFLIPSAFAAVECDQDADGYIVIPSAAMRAVDVPYEENGNYSPIQWQDFFNLYRTAELTEEEQCLGINFKKGAEPSRCDSIAVGPESGVYDPSRVTTPLRGAQVNPGAFDQPDNGIDEDCNGADASLLGERAPGAEKELGGLVQRTITLASRLVVFVSIIVMIWGGVLYATAAGDEQKTTKARKAIIGAVIGLIVGLLAPTIVNMIAASLA